MASLFQIHIDIPRTNPLIPLFQQPLVQEVREVLNVLNPSPLISLRPQFCVDGCWSLLLTMAGLQLTWCTCVQMWSPSEHFLVHSHVLFLTHLWAE